MVESITVLHLLVLPFPNSNSCQAFSEFITETILDRVANGSLSAWWRVGEVPPFHLVMPIAVEPSKPRVCHDERFFNLWIKDLPFSLGLITDLPRNVHKGGFQTISVFRQIVAPGLAFSGMPGTLFSIPSPLVGKPIPTCIALSV